MGYWIKRIILKDGEVVTERELREDENRFEGPVPITGDVVDVVCRGRKFQAKVIWGPSRGRVFAPDTVVPLRVAEVGLQEDTPLRFPSRSKP